MTPDQLEDVKADIYAEPWKDPQLFPDLLHKAIAELGIVATGGVLVVGDDTSYADAINRTGPIPRFAIDCEGTPVQEWAADLLRRMQGRARGGVPFDEPVYGDLGPTNPKDV